VTTVCDENVTVMVGAFPPPMNGMSAVNSAVHDALLKAGTVPMMINFAAPSLDRSLTARLSRLPRVLRGLGRLARKRALRGSTLYMSVSGGLGQFYELAFLLLARLRGMRIFLHHHSFAYLDKSSTLMRALIRAAGSGAVHIALSPGMDERLRSAYNVTRIVPISNAVFFMADERTAVERERLDTIGFLSNIAQEKGVFEFLDLMSAAQYSDLSLRARLAGPFQDVETERAVHSRLVELPNVEYVGPKYGAEKDAFYSSIDALMFPTRYVNEAEPLTIHEAMSRGIPVIAYGRGCIPEIVGSDGGLVIDPAEPFVPAALAQLGRWLAEPAAFRAASKTSAKRFASTYGETKARWHALLAEIVGTHMRADGADGGRS